MPRRLIQVLIGSLLGLAVAFAVVALNPPQQSPQIVRLESAPVAAGRAQIGGPFTLTDHTGQRVTDQSYAGKLRLMYFGFTFCPDICPTELQTFAEVMDALGSDAERVVPLFVTVDPERDTPQQLAEYVPLFHPTLVGLTGSADEIKSIAQSFRVFYARAEDPGASTYLMDHSTAVYLMGPDGEFLDIFGRATAADRIVERVRQRLAQG